MMKSGLYLNALAELADDDAIKIARKAEELQYDTILVAEPLFGENSSNGLCDALIETIAKHTQSIQIGSADRIIALDEPIDLGNQFLAMQNLSGNRFIGGVAVGEDAELFIERDVPFEKCRDFFSEMLGVLPAILDKEPLKHRGRHFEFEISQARSNDVPAPPVWVCARDYPTQSDAAKQGYAVLPYLLSEHRVVVEQYREFDQMLARENRLDGELERPLARDIFVANTESEACEIALNSYLSLYQRHAEFGELLDEKNLPKMLEDCDADNLLAHHLIIGDPDSVFSQLESLKSQCDYTQIIARMSLPNISMAATLESIRLFKEQVVPRLAQQNN